MGQVGRFAAVDAVRYPRHCRVIVRTRRGLEIGEVLSPPADGANGQAEADGDLLRGMTIEDELLVARLEKHRQAAYEACTRLLAEQGLPAVLVDVEHLFDGQSLLFYFLGETTPELDELTAELAEVYEARVQFRKFADTLTAGCGPGCGTEEAANGCASGACSTCAVACGTSTRRR
jgi:cell fate regulator YaaT (PSP1 superfamily)